MRDVPIHKIEALVSKYEERIKYTINPNGKWNWESVVKLGYPIGDNFEVWKSEYTTVENLFENFLDKYVPNEESKGKIKAYRKIITELNILIQVKQSKLN